MQCDLRNVVRNRAGGDEVRGGPDLAGSWAWLSGFILWFWCDGAIWAGAEEGHEVTSFKRAQALPVSGESEAGKEAQEGRWSSEPGTDAAGPAAVW